MHSLSSLYTGLTEIPQDDILGLPDKYGLPTSVRDRIRQEGKLKETLRGKVSSLLSDKRHNMKTYVCSICSDDCRGADYRICS